MLDFEELAFHTTALGELSLRRRVEPMARGEVVYEVKLGDEFLMSSLFTASEEALATLALEVVDGDALDVVVGGLGLGYTAAAALDSPRVRRLVVVDVLAEVIGWHRDGLVPLGERLTSDKRCEFVHASFFDFPALGPGMLDAARAGEKLDAILLDIDHSPRHWLTGGNASFYSPQTLRALRGHLRTGGVFGLWSNDPEDAEVMTLLDDTFAIASAHSVAFPNPYSGGESACTVYICGV